ncbi:MAG: transposase [Tissierellaceae bacterium]|nr:transposase [Tissierellaceae bacterium]
MPRYPREKSESGIYHVMIRGINKMNLFLEKNDKYKFLEILSKMKCQNEYLLFAYCLMDNHVHLLVKEEIESISMSMKRICVSYSYYFNKKYNRVGHVFQDRFRSERIEDDEYLLECMRYIHNNPVNANIVSNPKDFKFSSYNIYTNRDKDELKLVTREFLLSVFSEDSNLAQNQFVKFSNKTGVINFIDISDDDKGCVSDPLEKIENILDKYNHTLESILALKNVKERNSILKDIRENSNTTVTEISEIIGISKYIIYRA